MSMYLMHYASQYYDPVKAHEYYMRTRELKGRKSTKGLNEAGKNAAEYVKTQVDAERKQKLEEAKTNRNASLESARNAKAMQITHYASRTNAAIERMQAKLKTMNSAEKLRNRDKITSAIAKLRENNAQQKNQLNAAYGKKSAKIKGDYSTQVEAIKSQYDDVYLNELDKIKSNPEFTSGGKKGGKKSSGGSSVSSSNTGSNYKRLTYDEYKKTHKRNSSDAGSDFAASKAQVKRKNQNGK